MGRRRYVQDRKTGELVEVDESYVQELPQSGVGVLWGDRHYDGLCHTDGTPINSRTKHRDFMRARGLTTADDFTGEWQSARKQRDGINTTGGDHSERRAAVERALYETVNRRK